MEKRVFKRAPREGAVFLNLTTVTTRLGARDNTKKKSADFDVAKVWKRAPF